MTVGQLRQLVQAAVDDSQTSAAQAVLADVAAGCSSSSGGAAAAAASASGNGKPANGSPANGSSGASGVPAPLPALLAAALAVDLGRGLDGRDDSRRVAAFGANSLAAPATSSFLSLLLEAASDSTLLLLMAAGGLSLGLAAGSGGHGEDFIEGGAILASVSICVAVTAVTNYQKEAKFRQLNALKDDVTVRGVCVCEAQQQGQRQGQLRQQAVAHTRTCRRPSLPGARDSRRR